MNEVLRVYKKKSLKIPCERVMRFSISDASGDQKKWMCSSRGLGKGDQVKYSLGEANVNRNHSIQAHKENFSFRRGGWWKNISSQLDPKPCQHNTP